jgi:glycine cleavage system H protein
MFPLFEDLLFHREHTWVRLENSEGGKRFRIGLDEIFLYDVGQIDRLDFPNEGDEVSVDEVCGMVRGVGAKKMLYAPLSGEIIDVNHELIDSPDYVREDPYGVGWLLLIDPSDAEEEIGNLLSGKEAHEWWKAEHSLRGL